MCTSKRIPRHNKSFLIVFSSPRDKGGEEKHNLRKIARKTERQEYAKHIGTRLNSDVTSMTAPLAIEGVN